MRVRSLIITDATRAARLAICREPCEKLQADGSCSMCGCSVERMAKWWPFTRGGCRLGKWDQIARQK
jgi:hypothetical protein